jgi:deoxyribodipyrimidine photo-lyase
VLAVYIHEEEPEFGIRPLGQASKWWLHQSLNALNKQLDGKLCIRKGIPLDVLKELIAKHDITSIFWNRSYEPGKIKRDSVIKSALSEQGLIVKSFNAALLYEPKNILKKDGTPYRVFTPFYKKGCLESLGTPPSPLEKQEKINLIQASSLATEELALLPTLPWHKKLEKHWKPGESGAQSQLRNFLEDGLENYKNGRDFPAQNNTSRLSAHLHFGEISPKKLWHIITMRINSGEAINDGEHYLRELMWREFSYNQLFNFPHLPNKNLIEKFDAFPWRDDDKNLILWQKGETGIPIVDAGMKELWNTGYMHNRVRMITASFLVKNLLIHWKHGEKWFWDTLVDADLANNCASWQWVAGCGADAAPYFRIFNPVLQGQKFDKKGEYVRRHVPALANLPDKYIHSPWLAPDEILDKANIKIGHNYPAPIINLKASRDRALEAFKTIKNNS